MFTLDCKDWFVSQTANSRWSFADSKIKLLVLAVILFSAVGVDANANQENNKNQSLETTNEKVLPVADTKRKEKTKVFKVGVSYVNSFPLFSFANIEDKGYGWSVLEAFGKENNIKFEYIPMPMTRLQPLMDNGAIDFIFPDNPRWVAYRSNRFPNIYSGPIISAVSSTFVRETNLNLKAKDVHKVAIPFGYTAYTWFEPIQKYNIQSVPVRDIRAGLNALRIGSVEAADVEFNIGQYNISQDPMLSGLVVSKLLPNTPVDYHLSSIKHILVLEKLTAFVDANPQLLQSLKEKYKIKHHEEVFNGQ